MKTLFCASLIFVFMLGVSFGGETTPQEKWSMAFEKMGLTAYYKNSDFKDYLAKDGYIISFTRSYPHKITGESQFPLSLVSMDSSLRMGIDSTGFRIERDSDYDSYEFQSNPFVGLSVLGSFKNGDLYFDAFASMDFGELDNLQFLHKSFGIPVFPKKGFGSWNAFEFAAKLALKYSSVSYFVGLNSYQVSYTVKFTDYTGLPGYEYEDSGGVIQAGYVFGIDYRPNERLTFGFSSNIPSNQTVLEGYRLYASYIL